MVSEVLLTHGVYAKFDQAGVIVYQDPDHWLKAGIEASDGQPRLSAVVTNTYSDWSTQVSVACVPWTRSSDT